MSSVAPLLSVFVYGTLKRGQRNHDRYCRGAVAIEPARALGRLYRLPQGYPMLDVPPESVLALGSGDGVADGRKQLAHASPDGRGHRDAPAPGVAVDSSHDGALAPDAAASSPASDAANMTLGNWLIVRGELITFDDPAPRLLALDGLEAYCPDRQAGEYWRALIRLIEPAGLVAWTYIAPDGRLPAGAAPCGEDWP